MTESYLGPSADRFISRQVKYHLHKAPKNLLREDIEPLSDWVSVAASLIIEDSEQVKNYVNSLRNISAAKPYHS